MLPFERYQGRGRTLLGRPPDGDGSCRRGYGPSVFKECGTSCVYCGLAMGEFYRAWLQISVDHVVPRRMSASGYPIEWILDITNCVTACRACNDYLQDRIPDPPPQSLDLFFDLRDKVFATKLQAARKRHEVERTWFLDRSGLANFDEPAWLMDRLEEGCRKVARLLSALPLPFDANLHARLSQERGVYAIREIAAAPGVFLRAGRADSSGGLRQRVYQNHSMGDQRGNLRAQLVRAGRASDLQEAELWIQGQCAVQFLEIPDDEARHSAEHVILGLLQPEFGD